MSFLNSEVFCGHVTLNSFRNLCKSNFSGLLDNIVPGCMPAIVATKMTINQTQIQIILILHISDLLNPFQPILAFYIETSHLIWTENQLTVIYMKCNTGLKWGNWYLESFCSMFVFTKFLVMFWRSCSFIKKV